MRLPDTAVSPFAMPEKILKTRLDAHPGLEVYSSRITPLRSSGWLCDDWIRRRRVTATTAVLDLRPRQLAAWRALVFRPRPLPG